MNEEIEKIDSAKEKRSNKHRGHDDQLFNTIDKTPYRGYGFSEVCLLKCSKYQMNHRLLEERIKTVLFDRYLIFHLGSQSLDKIQSPFDW